MGNEFGGLNALKFGGTRIVVTLDIVSEVLYVPRVEHPDYLGCERLRIMSKGEMISAFYERPANWGDRQFTPCLTFVKGSRFMNMVMTFVLHPLSHYNSITKPHARFLLSLLEHLTIDFPSHFILSIIDAYRDMTTCDKLIFPSVITRILRHFFVPFPVSNHFHVMCAIDALPLNGPRRSFIRDGLICQVLSLFQLHPPPLPLLLREVWLWMRSWHNFSTWILTLIHSLLSCIRWTPVSAVLLDARLRWVVTSCLPLL